MIYIILIIVSVFGCFIKNNKTQKIACFFFILLMTIIVGMRSTEVGPDTRNYFDYFDNPTEDKEFLYYFICNTLKNLHFNPIQIQIALSFITYVPLLLLINRYSVNPMMSCLIFIIAPNLFFFETMNIVRQACAVPYILWCFIFFQESKIKYAIAFFIISIGFHLTSILMVPIMIIARYWHPKFKLVLLIVPLSVVIGVSISASSLLEYFTLFSQIEEGGMDKFSFYSKYTVNMDKSIFSIVPTFLTSGTCIYFAYKKLSNWWIRVFLFGTLTNNMLYFLPIGPRMMFPIMCMEILIIPYLFKKAKRSKTILTLLIMLLFAVFLMRLNIVGSDGIGYNPYSISKAL